MRAWLIPRRRLPDRGRPIPRKHLVQLFLQLQMLLSSGILVSDALDRLRRTFPHAGTRLTLREVHAQVAESRLPLSRALAGLPRSFPSSVVVPVRIGEEGGALQLAERLGDLAEQLAYEDRVRRLIRRACAYPLFIASLAFALHLFLLGVAFPRLAELLASLGGDLPPLTRAVLAASAFVQHRWFLLAGAPCALAGGVAALRRCPSAALRLDGWFLRVPLAGPIYRCLAAALLCRAFRSLYRANHPAPGILDLCAPLVRNRAFREGLREIRRRLVAEGATVASAFAASGLFPPLVCMAVDVGERTGRIAEALERVTNYLQEEARERLATLVAVVNPALTLAVVGGVGLVFLAFFQALYQTAYASR